MDIDLAGGAKKVADSDLYKWGTGIAGFVMGVTEKAAAANGDGYRTNIAWQLKDTLSNLGIGGVTVAPGFTSVSGAGKFNIFGFLNKGFAVAVGLELADMLIDGKAVDTIKKLVQPGAWGYSAGGLFDPAPNGSSSGAYASGSSASGGYVIA